MVFEVIQYKYASELNEFYFSDYLDVLLKAWEVKASRFEVLPAEGSPAWSIGGPGWSEKSHGWYIGGPG